MKWLSHIDLKRIPVQILWGLVVWGQENGRQETWAQSQRALPLTRLGCLDKSLTLQDSASCSEGRREWDITSKASGCSYTLSSWGWKIDLCIGVPGSPGFPLVVAWQRQSCSLWVWCRRGLWLCEQNEIGAFELLKFSNPFLAFTLSLWVSFCLSVFIKKVFFPPWE